MWYKTGVVSATPVEERLDQALAQEAAKLDRPIDPNYGQEVARGIQAALDLPDAVVRELKAAIGCVDDSDACQVTE